MNIKPENSNNVKCNKNVRMWTIMYVLQRQDTTCNSNKGNLSTNNLHYMHNAESK